MKTLRDPGMLTGFYFEDPLPGVPYLTHVGEAVCSSAHFVPPHKHRGFEFTYLIQGSLRIQVGSRCFDIGPGEVAATCPVEIHQWPLRRHSGYQHLWLGIDLDGMTPAGRELAQYIRGGTRIIRTSHDVEPVMRGLIRQMFHPRPYSKEVSESLLSTFVALLLQSIKADNQDKTQHSGPYSPEIESVVAFLVENLARRLTLDEAAAQSGHSRSWLCERFVREVGVPPQTYHLRLRLEAAREALLQSEATIADTALNHGFSSSQHFSAAFSQAFGVSPRQWRQQSRMEVPHGASRAPAHENETFTAHRFETLQKRL